MTDTPQQPLPIVEDEMFIRMIAADALEDRGFSIVEAGDAREALEILERSPEIALIFTDINMPGAGGGKALAAHRDHRHLWWGSPGFGRRSRFR